MLTRYLFPVSPAQQFRREFERLLDSFGVAGDLGTLFDEFPALNVWEEADTLVAEAELPGMRMEDLEVVVVGNELTIKGQRTAGDDKPVTFHRQERTTGAFSRSLRLPYDINPEAVDATLRDGILTIRLPKAESARARKITVKSV